MIGKRTDTHVHMYRCKECLDHKGVDHRYMSRYLYPPEDHNYSLVNQYNPFMAYRLQSVNNSVQEGPYREMNYNSPRKNWSKGQD